MLTGSWRRSRIIRDSARVRASFARAASQRRVACRSNGNQFCVSANLDGAMDVTLMVDTGAAMTVLGAQRLLMLGYDLDAAPKRYFSTAGGVVRPPVVRLDRFELGGRTVRNWPVGAIDMSLAAEAAGLLGMDFLSRHRFAIDQDRQLLILGPGAATND